MALSKQDREEIIEIIELKVNGKIDTLQEEVRIHNEEVMPFIRAASGFKILYKGLIAFAAIAVALDQLTNFGIIKSILSHVSK